MTGLDAPLPVCVSVIMANFNGERFLPDAIESVRNQTLADWELLICDDASTDGSAAIVQRYAARDPRIKLIRNETNSGPAAARNRALSAAKGAWLAIMDSDDIMHPARLKTLIASAAQDGAAIVADDMIVFYQDRSRPPHGLLSSADASTPRRKSCPVCGMHRKDFLRIRRTSYLLNLVQLIRGKFAQTFAASGCELASGCTSEPFWVDTAEFVRSNTFYSRGAGLGYLKPIIQADLLRKASCRYDETLTIGEDYDFIFRLLVAGLKYRVLPRQLYYYRKHGGSISHRLSSKAARAMLDAEQRFLPQLTGTNPEILAAVEGRRKSLETVLVFNSLIAALKSRRLAESAGRILRCPRLLPLLREPLQAWFSRFRAKLLSLAAAGSYSPRKTAQ